MEVRADDTAGSRRALKYHGGQVSLAHLVGSLVGIYAAVHLSGSEIDPTTGNSTGTGLAAGFLFVFGLFQGLIHAGIGAFFRARLSHATSNRLRLGSFTAGFVSIIMIFSLLNVLRPSGPLEAIPPGLVLLCLFLPGLATSIAVLKWAASGTNLAVPPKMKPR